MVLMGKTRLPAKAAFLIFAFFFIAARALFAESPALGASLEYAGESGAEAGQRILARFESSWLTALLAAEAGGDGAYLLGGALRTPFFAIGRLKTPEPMARLEDPFSRDVLGAFEGPKTSFLADDRPLWSLTDGGPFPDIGFLFRGKEVGTGSEREAWLARLCAGEGKIMGMGFRIVQPLGVPATSLETNADFLASEIALAPERAWVDGGGSRLIPGEFVAYGSAGAKFSARGFNLALRVDSAKTEFLPLASVFSAGAGLSFRDLRMEAAGRLLYDCAEDPSLPFYPDIEGRAAGKSGWAPSGMLEDGGIRLSWNNRRGPFLEARAERSIGRKGPLPPDPANAVAGSPARDCYRLRSSWTGKLLDSESVDLSLDADMEAERRITWYEDALIDAETKGKAGIKLSVDRSAFFWSLSADFSLGIPESGSGLEGIALIVPASLPLEEPSYAFGLGIDLRILSLKASGGIRAHIGGEEKPLVPRLSAEFELPRNAGKLKASYDTEGCWSFSYAWKLSP
jgi:hypothetical protein